MQEIESIYRSYLFLKDSIRITARVIEMQVPGVQKRTIFDPMQYDKFKKEHGAALSDIENLVVLALFAAFERTLRDNLSEKLDVLKTIWPVEFGAGIYKLTNAEIEMWSIEEIFSLFGFKVGKDNINRLKEILKYRNWIAHGKNQNKFPPARINPKMAYDAIQYFTFSISDIGDIENK